MQNMFQCWKILTDKHGNTKRCGQWGGATKMKVERTALKAGEDPTGIAAACRCRLHVGDLVHAVSLAHAFTVVESLNAEAADAALLAHKIEMKRQGNLTVAQAFGEIKAAVKAGEQSKHIFFCSHAACASVSEPKALSADETFVYLDHKLDEDNTLVKHCRSFSCYEHHEWRAKPLTFRGQAHAAVVLERMAEADRLRKVKADKVKAEQKEVERANRNKRTTQSFDGWKRLQQAAAERNGSQSPAQSATA